LPEEKNDDKFAATVYGHWNDKWLKRVLIKAGNDQEASEHGK
jgi:hypothetical protein